MNINKIKNKFLFLIEIGYSYSNISVNRVFYVLQFEKSDFIITLHFDCHNEFLDLTIRQNTRTLLKTSYDNVVIDNLNWEEKKFSQLLKDIYSLPNNSYSISREQFCKLIDLYVDFIKSYLRSEGYKYRINDCKVEIYFYV